MTVGSGSSHRWAPRNRTPSPRSPYIQGAEKIANRPFQMRVSTFWNKYNGLVHLSEMRLKPKLPRSFHCTHAAQLPCAGITVPTMGWLPMLTR